jgi:hypothetical protein
MYEDRLEAINQTSVVVGIRDFEEGYVLFDDVGWGWLTMKKVWRKRREGIESCAQDYDFYTRSFLNLALAMLFSFLLVFNHSFAITTIFDFVFLEA